MSRRCWLLFALVGLSVACQVVASPSPAPTAVPVATAVPGRATATPSAPGRERLAIRQADGSVVGLLVEIADTPDKRAIGLSGRQQLDPDAGMLFVFEQTGRYEFWMRGTTIPLAIAFVAEDGSILDIQEMEPLTEDRHAPASPFRSAVEVNRDFFRSRGVRTGDRIELPAGAR